MNDALPSKLADEGVVSDLNLKLEFVPVPLSYKMYTVFNGEGRILTSLEEPFVLRHTANIPYHRTEPDHLGLTGPEAVGQLFPIRSVPAPYLHLPLPDVLLRQPQLLPVMNFCRQGNTTFILTRQWVGLSDIVVYLRGESVCCSSLYLSLPSFSFHQRRSRIRDFECLTNRMWISVSFLLGLGGPFDTIALSYSLLALSVHVTRPIATSMFSSTRLAGCLHMRRQISSCHRRPLVFKL